MKRLLLSATIFAFFGMYSCRHVPKEKEVFEPTFSTYREVADTVAQHPKNEIFYGVLTPVEISTIFSRLNISLVDSALNPTSNSNLYLSNSKAALNTGVYGVNFGYLKLFGIGQKMLDYMVTIRELSSKLGIPDQYLTKPLRNIQLNMAEPDTVMKLMNEAFYEIEDHLRSGGRESTAGLIILGGWVEALYIATQAVYDPLNPDPEVVQKIAEQKYTLTALLSFLKNYYDDPVVVYYTKKLLFLKRYFDTFDIYFKKDDLEIDKNKQIFRSSGSAMTITVETLNQIRDYAVKLRTEIVTP
jgi:hypothetical protein